MRSRTFEVHLFRTRPDLLFRMKATMKAKPLLSRLDTFTYLRGVGV